MKFVDEAYLPLLFKKQTRNESVNFLKFNVGKIEGDT